jgi:hypothetical protein
VHSQNLQTFFFFFCYLLPTTYSSARARARVHPAPHAARPPYVH